MGDILTFEQPLLDSDMTQIGRNSGHCIRVQVQLSYQCTWTLTFTTLNGKTNSIQVAGLEYDNGESTVSIIGGTGKFQTITGDMVTTNNADGTFTQVLHYQLKSQAH